MKNAASIVNRDRFCLQVKQYRMWLCIGVTEEERRVPQPVDIDIEVRLAELPLATETDDLEDTVCYATLLERIGAVAAEKPIKLLEHLVAKLGEAVQAFVLGKGYQRNQCNLRVAVTKVVTPVRGILGGVTVVWFK